MTISLSVNPRPRAPGRGVTWQPGPASGPGAPAGAAGAPVRVPGVSTPESPSSSTPPVVSGAPSSDSVRGVTDRPSSAAPAAGSPSPIVGMCFAVDPHADNVSTAIAPWIAVRSPLLNSARDQTRCGRHEISASQTRAGLLAFGDARRGLNRQQETTLHLSHSEMFSSLNYKPRFTVTARQQESSCPVSLDARYVSCRPVQLIRLNLVFRPSATREAPLQQSN